MHYHAKIHGVAAANYTARTQEDALDLATARAHGRTVTVRPCNCSNIEAALSPDGGGLYPRASVACECAECAERVGAS